MSETRETPDPRLLRAALDERDERPWRYYHLEYDDLKRGLDARVDTINALKAERDTLAAQITTLQGAIAAQDAREQAAGASCGVSGDLHGCDWPDAVAERVVSLQARAEAAEARVLTAERERDEARAKSAIDEAGYDHILTTAQALQARVTALETALRDAEKFIHPGISRGPAITGWQETVDRVAALTAPQAGP